MKLKKIIEEDLNHYKDYVLLLFSPKCNWKCCIGQNIPTSVCANYVYHDLPDIEFPDKQILKAFVSNPLHSAVCVAGAEPLDSEDLSKFISFFRVNNASPIIIYTGYTADEEKTVSFIKWIKKNKINNVILKVGRYEMNGDAHLDPLLGVTLLGHGQYAIQIS